VLVLVLLPQQMRPKCLICMRIYPDTGAQVTDSGGG
jgi:hypothetical protein